MTTDPPTYTSFPVRGRGPEGAFNVSIYAKDQAAAEAEYTFRYMPIGCVPLSTVIEEDVKPEEPKIDLPVVKVRKRG